MKHSGPPIPTTRHESPIRFSDFILVAAFLTLCIFPIVNLLAASLAAKRHDSSVWEIATFLTLFSIWVGTLTVGCLVTINPVWTQQLAALALGRIGPEARAALPALTQLAETHARDEWDKLKSKQPEKQRNVFGDMQYSDDYFIDAICRIRQRSSPPK